MGCSVPFIVEKVALTGQTSSISTTTLYTSSSGGDYRIDIYAAGSDGTASAAVVIGWTDEFRSNTYSASSLNASGTTPGQGSVVVHLGAGDSITYHTNGVNGSYDLFLTVTQE